MTCQNDSRTRWTSNIIVKGANLGARGVVGMNKHDPGSSALLRPASPPLQAKANLHFIGIC